MRVTVKSHALPVYKKNRIVSLLCIFESIVVIHSFDTKKTQNGVNKKDKIMHSQGGKGIFSQFKKYLQEFIEENQKRC